MEIEGLFGLGALKEDAKDIALLGVGAGAAVLVGETLFAKVEMLRKMSPNMKAVTAAVLGIAGGVAVGRYVNRGLGAGVGAGLFGWAVAEIARPMVGGALKGLGATSDESLLLGLGYSNTDVQDFRPLPGQPVDGLGEYGDANVNVSDEAQIPGGGYLSGLGSFIS